MIPWAILTLFTGLIMGYCLGADSLGAYLVCIIIAGVVVFLLYSAFSFNA